MSRIPGNPATNRTPPVARAALPHSASAAGGGGVKNGTSMSFWATGGLAGGRAMVRSGWLGGSFHCTRGTPLKCLSQVVQARLGLPRKRFVGRVFVSPTGCLLSSYRFIRRLIRIAATSRAAASAAQAVHPGTLPFLARLSPARRSG